MYPCISENLRISSEAKTFVQGDLRLARSGMTGHVGESSSSGLFNLIALTRLYNRARWSFGGVLDHEREREHSCDQLNRSRSWGVSYAGCRKLVLDCHHALSCIHVVQDSKSKSKTSNVAPAFRMGIPESAFVPYASHMPGTHQDPCAPSSASTSAGTYCMLRALSCGVR